MTALYRLLLFYSAGLVAARLALASPLAALWPLQLLAVAGPWPYLPLLLLVPPFIFPLRRRQHALLALPLLVALADYGPALLPHPPSAVAPTLRVMTWNVELTTVDVATVTAAIRREQPDIVALQELNPTLSAALAAALRDRYPHMRLHPDTGFRGLGVFSRFPLRDAQPPDLDLAGCRCQYVQLDLDGRAVTLIQSHPHRPRVPHVGLGPFPLPLGFDTREADKAIDAVLTDSAALAQPILLVGDFNTTERQLGYARLRTRFADAFAAAGWGPGFTYPRGAHLGPLPVPPLVRIDYIFHSREWTTSAARTGAAVASDHRYLVAALALH